jgi:hypothetical protein
MPYQQMIRQNGSPRRTSGTHLARALLLFSAAMLVAVLAGNSRQLPSALQHGSSTSTSSFWRGFPGCRVGAATASATDTSVGSAETTHSPRLLDMCFCESQTGTRGGYRQNAIAI